LKEREKETSKQSPGTDAVASGNNKSLSTWRGGGEERSGVGGRGNCPAG